VYFKNNPNKKYIVVSEKIDSIEHVRILGIVRVGRLNIPFLRVRYVFENALVKTVC